MININTAKNSERAKFIESILGSPHMIVNKDGKAISVWCISEEDKKVLDEFEKETLVR
jgi:hypothetical protein